MEIQLYYQEKGTGIPLVLLHGNGENGTYFQHQIDEFSKDYRVIAVDTRGHGNSPRGSSPFTLGQFAEDLKAFLDKMGLSHVILLGFSDGGNIAMLFTLRYPGYVDRLILNGANLYPAGVHLKVQIPILLGYGITSLLALFSAQAAKNRDFLRLMVKEPHIAPDDLGKIRIPVLVIAGTDDMIREKHTRKIAAALPDSQLVFIEGDHFIARKNSISFNQAVRGFLEQKGKGRGDQK